MRPLAVLFFLLAGCEASPPLSTVVFASESERAVATAFTEHLPTSLGAGVRVDPDPLGAMARSTEGTRRIALVLDPEACAGCYRLEEVEGGVVARGDRLGIQYGLAHYLESMGVRFFHPSRTFVPEVLGAPDPSIFGVAHAPDIAERGLQLHVLHPIESYFDFWEPSPENLADAERTLHWIVCNRGNFVTYTALENIEAEAPRAAWTDHVRAILEAAHLRGIRVGLGMQLFGRSSLQQALVLVPDDASPPAPQMDTRLALLGDLPFDSFNLAFGEFFGAEPAVFVSTIELAYDAIHARWPEAEVTATVHVGDFPDTRITYMGEDQLYYFLVRYADRPIVPWLHTVMYYTLFEPAGGAYNHADFFEHRDYLFGELAAGRPAGYHPETAYWIAFDNSLPMYLPLYVRSRFYDLDEIQAVSAAPLTSHVVFSSGWEWGYWQSDVAVMRMSYELPARYEDLFTEMFAPLEQGAALASTAVALSDLSHEALMVDALAPYLASTDATFALGLAMDFWSQPRRPEMSEVIAMDDAALDAFELAVLGPLRDYRDGLIAIRDAAPRTGDPFGQELFDGVAIDAARASFAYAVWSAAAASGRGGPIDALVADAEAARAEAEGIVRRRHAALLDTDGATLIARRVLTAGLYDYGYLREADRLCFYDRELAQLRNAALGMSLSVPGCVL